MIKLNAIRYRDYMPRETRHREEKKRGAKGGGGKKKRLYEGGKAGKRNGLKFRATLYRPRLLNFMRRPSFLPSPLTPFFFHRVTRPVKTRHTSHISLYPRRGEIMYECGAFLCVQTDEKRELRPVRILGTLLHE